MQQNGDPLESLLQRADAEAGAGPGLREDWPQRVRQVAARRARRVRLSMGAAAVSVLLAGGLIWMFSVKEPSGAGAGNGVGPSEAEQVAALRAEIERLDAEVAALTVAVREMRELEAEYARLRELGRELAGVDMTTPAPVEASFSELARLVDRLVFSMMVNSKSCAYPN